MSGGYEAIDSAGLIDTDLTKADYLLFGPDNGLAATMVKSATGSFIPTIGLQVSIASPLQVNPAVVPAGPIWSVGDFSLTLSSLVESTDITHTLILKGVGLLHDAGGTYDDTEGTWTATFNSSSTTFSWNSGSGATSSVPDGGSTLLLLGSAFGALATLARLRPATK